MNIVNSLKIISYVVYYNLLIFKKKILNETINFTIWGAISTFVTGTLLVKSTTTQFATVQFCGVIANVGLWVSFHEIVDFITDIENKKRLFYNLSIPLSSYLFFVSKVIFYIIRFSILTLLLTIIFKIILSHIISFESISLLKFLAIIITTNAFYGSWIIFISSIIKKSQHLGNLFGRIQFPLWFMGGFQFSWVTLYQSNKVLAYIDLLNPILYINEGFKNAILNREGILSFAHLILVITLFSMLLFHVGYRRLKKQLDFI